MISSFPREGRIVGRQILIRDVPEPISSWLDRKKYEERLSLKEVLLSILQRACNDSKNDNARTLFSVDPQPIAAPEFTPFTFVDLFAGIGGFRLALNRLGGRCSFSCEWDKYSQKTYSAWFGEVPVGDIREIKPSEIPDHDVMAAGFPCQPFSIAGVSKKKSLGLAHGFKDATQGTLFFNLATIIEAKRPPVVLLENVKNLLSHNRGTTWNVIRSSLESLGYTVFHKVIDAAGWVPQHRERIFIVAFDQHLFGHNPPFKFPETPSGKRPRLRDILDPSPSEKYILTDHLWNYLQQYAERHRARGNGFGFGMADLNGITRTLSARYYKDGSEILIPRPQGNPRRLTPREAARLMGFPDDKPIVVSDTQAYRQFGNAVVPPVAEAVGREVMRTLSWFLLKHRNRCLVKGRSLSEVAV